MSVSLQYPDNWFDVDEDADAVLTTKQETEMEEVANYLHGYFESDGYQLDTINITDVGKNAAGTYSGRKGDVPQIDISSLKRKQVLAHEIGHDVFRYLDMAAPTEKKHKYFNIAEMTFDESFAYLTEKMTANALEHSPLKHPSPFSEDDEAPWNDLRETVDIEKQEEVYGYIQEAIEAAADRDDERLDDLADQMNTIAPVIDYDSGLFYEYSGNNVLDPKMNGMAMLKAELAKLAGKKQQWNMDPEGESEYTAKFLNKLSENDELHTLCRRFITSFPDSAGQDDIPFDTFAEHLYPETLDRSIDKTLSLLKSEIETHLDNLYNIPEYRVKVKTQIHKRDSYGKEFDPYYDFPHRVGNALAGIYNASDITPKDMLKQPEPFIEYSSKAIDYTIDKWMDTDGVPLFDPNEMAEYIQETGGTDFPSFNPGRPKLLGDG